MPNSIINSFKIKTFKTMKHSVLLLASLFFSLCANGQSSLKLSGKSISQLRAESQEAPLRNQSFPKNGFHRSASTVAPSYPTLRESLATSTPPKAWRYCDLALFCRLEVRMEKAIKFPFKVRLGETQEVERREGKLNDGVNKSH